MAGLLSDDWDDPRNQGLLALGLGLLGSRGSFAQGLSQAGQQAMGVYGAGRQRQRANMREDERDTQAQAAHQMQQQMAQIQLQQAQAAQQRQQQFQELAQRSARSPQQTAMGANGGPTLAAAQAVPTAQAGFDVPGYIKGLWGLDPERAIAMEASLRKDDAPMVLAEGARAFNRGGTEIASNPKAADLPSAVREFEYGQKNPAFNPWQMGLKRAGATNIGMPKIEVKLGESVAGQIGPMAKDSRIQAQGAVGMFDSADRIQKALDSGKVSAGPFTTQIQTVKQLVQKVGGGSDDGIRQTRQVIKGLAQMSVEARKELQGQGQVTESEAAAVAKAESGDINDLTTGELQDLVTLTKRAAHMRAKSHQSILDSMAGSEATRGLVPFYKLNNMDSLLKHDPQLPQIGGGIDDLVKKYGGGR